MQAASSHHAAELLASSGHTLQIVTFGDCQPFETTPSMNRDVDDDLFDPKFQIALKKTMKKDLHTREKVMSLPKFVNISGTLEY